MGCTNNPRNPSPYDSDTLDLMFRHCVFGEFDEEITSFLLCGYIAYKPRTTSHQLITSTIGNYEAILTQDLAIQANIHQSIIVLLIQMKLSARNRRQMFSGLKSSDKWSAWFALWIVACRASPLVLLPHHRILETMVQSRPWHRNVTSFIGEKWGVEISTWDPVWRGYWSQPTIWRGFQKRRNATWWWCAGTTSISLKWELPRIVSLWSSKEYSAGI